MTASVRGVRFSLVLPVSGAADEEAATVASLRAQTLPDWELLVPHPGAGGGDGQARCVDIPDGAGEADVANRAVAMARGEFLMAMRPGDTLEPGALLQFARLLEDDPLVDVVYCDEVDGDGPATGPATRPARKPAWSPERLRHQDYLGRACVLRTSLVVQVGGFRPGFEGAAQYDLVLRATERARRIAHLASRLFAPVAVEPPVAPAAAQRAVQDHLDRLGIDAAVGPGPAPGLHRVRRRLSPDQLVSIIVPTRGQTGVVGGAQRAFVVEAVRSALTRTAHRRIEVVVVFDESTSADTLEALRAVAGERLVALEYRGPFNFSRKCNLGVLGSRGDVVVLLNDDTDVVSQGWLEELVAPLAEPDVGMTGAKLLYEDGTLQHAGHLYASGGRPPHPLHAYRWCDDGIGPAGDLVIDRECSGVTAACAALRREVYDEIGGLSELVPVNFNDVDLSLKVRQGGRRIVWMSHCVLYHFESKSRVQSRAKPEETAFLERRWPGSFRRDEYVPWLTFEESAKPPARG